MLFLHVSSQHLPQRCCDAAQVVRSRRGRIGAVEEGTLPGDTGAALVELHEDGIAKQLYYRFDGWYCIDHLTVCDVTRQLLTRPLFIYTDV